MKGSLALTDTEDVEPISDEDRIRNNLDYWSMDESLGTYRADRDDYGKVDVSVLRDLQLLRTRLDATTEKLAEAEKKLEGWTYLTSRVAAAESRLAAAEAALRGLRSSVQAVETVWDDGETQMLLVVTPEACEVADEYLAAAPPTQEAEPCPHCGSTVRPGAKTCPVCGPHAHGAPTQEAEG